jgi:tetratricopeptide (TPR) repeat protein
MCGKKEGLNSCSGCLQRDYCSEECQKKAWAEHKPLCRAYKAVGLELKDPEQIANKLLAYSRELGRLNLHQSEVRVVTEVLAFCKRFNVSREMHTAKYNLATTLVDMARHSEAEIFAREMIADLESVAPVGLDHVMAAEKLSTVLLHQTKFEEARLVAHDAVERFCPRFQDMSFMVRLLEAESAALRYLGRSQDALFIQEQCFLFQDSQRFPERVTVNSLHAYAVLLIDLGRREEAEASLQKALVKLESEGLEFHPNVVFIKSSLRDVYLLQGRKKEAAAMLKVLKKLVPQVFPVDHPGYKHHMEMTN